VPPCIYHSKEKEAELPDNRKAPTFIAEDRGENSAVPPYFVLKGFLFVT